MKSVIPSELVAKLREAESVAVLTGAGVSAESGIPTFRDSQEGLWSKYDPAELATPEAFERNPQLVSRWYDWRRERCAAGKPNAAHYALARLERHFAKWGFRFTLITQNVDRLHQAAGSSGVIELHGTLWIWRCVRCGEEHEERQVPFAEHPPRCACGGFRRPGVVWFGEALPESAMAAASHAAQTCDLFFSIGTSSVVYPAAGLARIAQHHAVRIVEINTQPTPLSLFADWCVQGLCGVVLPELVNMAFKSDS
jgi:NAD-dependent deacetylase